MDNVVFTAHALNKFSVLRKHKFIVSEDEVIKTVTEPESIDSSRYPLLIAQRQIDKKHVLRVVYKKEIFKSRLIGEREFIKIITFYPERLKQYEEK